MRGGGRRPAAADRTHAGESTPPDASGFDRRNVLLISGAHFAHDVYPAFLGVMLPLLIDELGISLALAGVLASAIRWTTSTQPFLGHWADHTDTRYWVIVTPATTAACMGLLGVAPNTAVVVTLLLLAGLSHAAFHPAGGALATRAAGDAWGKGMSYFMTGGELGRVVGPLFIAGVVALGGMRLAPVAVIPGILASLVLYRQFRGAAFLEISGRAPAKILEAVRAGRRALVLLSTAILLRSFANVAIVVFYPTYAVRLGHPLLVAGLALTLYEVGAVAGTFVGGVLSDRHGGKRVMLTGLVVAVVPLAGAVVLGPSPFGLTLIVLAGFALLSATSVELVMMQQLLPENRSAAVGTTYFMKAAGAIVATVAIGVLGDVIGLRETLLASIAVGGGAAPFIAFLRESADGKAAATAGR